MIKEEKCSLKEIWRKIDINYSISSHGGIKSPYKTLSPTYAINNYGRGYYTVRMYGKIYSLANLVAKHFLPSPPGMKKNKVTYIDGDSRNVRASNLRYLTSEDYSNLKKGKTK